MPPATTPRAPTRPRRRATDGVADAPVDPVPTVDVDVAGIGGRTADARRAAGLTLAGVAQRSGLSPAYVSQIESGTANPTLRALAQVAGALGADLAQLVGAGGEPVDHAFPAYHSGVGLPSGSPGVQGIWDRTADGPRRLTTRILRADAGDHAVPVRHPGEEYLLVLQGGCRLHVGADTYPLRPGDSCHFAAAEPHHLSALTADLTLSVVIGS